MLKSSKCEEPGQRWAVGTAMGRSDTGAMQEPYGTNRSDAGVMQE